MNEPNIGTVVTVIGPVVDIRFKAGQLPNLLNAIEVMNNGQKLTLEVAQHVGDDIVRCIAMSSTDGLMRGVDAVDTGAPISVPVGNETLGRIFNLLGEAVDNKPTPVTEEKWPIHRPAPSLEEQGGTTEIDPTTATAETPGRSLDGTATPSSYHHCVQSGQFRGSISPKSGPKRNRWASL